MGVTYCQKSRGDGATAYIVTWYIDPGPGWPHRGLLKFLEVRDYLLEPVFFRIQPPKLEIKPLPRYLAEIDYRRLEKTILLPTEVDSYNTRFDRAWFFTLAHTEVRISSYWICDWVT